MLALGPRPQQSLDPIGGDRSGVDADDPHTIARRRGPERPREGHQGGVAAAAGDGVRLEAFARRPDDIDHDAAPFPQSRVKRAGEADGAEHLEVPRGPPSGVVDREQVAGRDRAGVVDQHVERPRRRRDPLDLSWLGQVGRYDLHRHLTPFPHGRPRLGQVGGGARDEDEVAALLRQQQRRGEADALRAPVTSTRFPRRYRSMVHPAGDMATKRRAVTACVPRAPIV